MREEVRSIVMVRDTSAGLGADGYGWIDLDRAVRDGLDEKMLGCVGSDQLTGIRTTRWSERRVKSVPMDAEKPTGPATQYGAAADLVFNQATQAESALA